MIDVIKLKDLSHKKEEESKENKNIENDNED